jgi:hypothetical protein
MLKILVSFALGPWGMEILYFYLRNAAIINSIVFIYGAFLVTAHMNYRKISDQVFNQIAVTDGKKSGKKVLAVNIPLAIHEKKMFPYVAGQISLFPRKTSTAAVKNYLQKEKRWKDLVTGREVKFLE